VRIGTKSLLFGTHQVFIHPWFVAVAWRRLYGFPLDPRLWVAFFVHDLGYWGKPNMDGPEGERHPELGARIMGEWFDRCHPDNHDCIPYMVDPERETRWYFFALYHSRFLAKQAGKPFSRLCAADKLALAMTWRWLYLLQTNLTGEIHEYMRGQGARTPAGECSQWHWITDVQTYVRAWAWEHRDGRADKWTGTIRDLCINDNTGGAA
jgi:hypothetical protein